MKGGVPESTALTVTAYNCTCSKSSGWDSSTLPVADSIVNGCCAGSMEYWISAFVPKSGSIATTWINEVPIARFSESTAEYVG